MANRIPLMVFSLSSLLAVIIMIMSMGWFLMLSSVVLIPVTVFHFIVGTRALKRKPGLQSAVILAGIVFLVFSLIRPDGDDLNAYTGYSMLMYKLGLSAKQYTEPWKYMFELAFGVLMVLLVLDIWIFNQSKRNPSLGSNEKYFV